MTSALARPPTLLFLSTAHAARARLAEALAIALLPGRVVHAAGLKPRAIHPMALRALALRGVPPRTHPGVNVQDIVESAPDIVVTLSAEAGALDLWPTAVRLDWRLSDPAFPAATDAAVLKRFVAARDEVERRIRFELMPHPRLNRSTMLEPSDAAK